MKISKSHITVIVFLIIIISFISIFRTISGTNTPFTIVISGSMEPTIPTGSLVFIKKVNASEIIANRTNGDIIVYMLPNTKVYDFFIFVIYDPLPIMHRAIDKKEISDKFYILTKGDANLLPDGNPNNPLTWVSEDRIIGKVVWYFPYMGYYIIILIIVTAIIIMIIPERRKSL
ncbi:MAG: signal peptidase I [Candidatus Verstraetearchaeota archaeon]|jgi:signal peptidase|nr:signal peptidase I [Candidatus Verstraetearchaeota archaeon]